MASGAVTYTQQVPEQQYPLAAPRDSRAKTGNKLQSYRECWCAGQDRDRWYSWNMSCKNTHANTNPHAHKHTKTPCGLRTQAQFVKAVLRGCTAEYSLIGTFITVTLNYSIVPDSTVLIPEMCSRLCAHPQVVCVCVYSTHGFMATSQSLNRYFSVLWSDSWLWPFRLLSISSSDWLTDKATDRSLSLTHPLVHI